MLEDDRHLLGVLRQQSRRKLHALGGRQEGDEEMVLAGEPVLGGIGQYTAQHPAQRVASQHVVSDMIGGNVRSCRILLPADRRRHRQPDSPVRPCYPGGAPRSVGVAAAGGNSSQGMARSIFARKCSQPMICAYSAKPAPTFAEYAPGKLKWRLLLPGDSEPRLAELNPLGLQTWFFKPLTRPEQPEHSCRLQLLHSPITAEQYREKTRPLRPRRSCFAPAETRAFAAGFCGGAGGCPPVRMGYFGGHFFSHPPRPDAQYKVRKIWKKKTPQGFSRQ